MTAATIYEGDWRKLGNPSADRKGSIHDDEPARQLGFKGAFVPGSVVGTCAMPAIIERYGKAWFDGGWFDMTFVSPVYTSDSVRAVARDADEGMAFEVVTDDDRLCCAGRAGTGYIDPWSTSGGPDDVFPDAHIGERFEDQAIEITREHTAGMLGAGGDPAPLWDDLIPPLHLMAVALQMVDWHRVPVPGTRPPGMWARHAIKVNSPMPYGSYVMKEYLVEKGASGRTLYVEFQFSLHRSSGEEVAVGRHKCKFIRADV